MQAEHQTLVRIKKQLESQEDSVVIDALLGPSRRSSAPKITTKITYTPGGMKRLDLQPGGSLDVPREVLEDPKQRLQLARNLEVLAEWLVSCTPQDDDDDEGADR